MTELPGLGPNRLEHEGVEAAQGPAAMPLAERLELAPAELLRNERGHLREAHTVGALRGNLHAHEQTVPAIGAGGAHRVVPAMA